PNVAAFDHNGNVLVAGGTAVTRLVANSPDVNLNNAGHLFVNTTDANDTIAFEHAGDQLIVHRDDIDTSFNFAEVNQLTVFPSAGDDVISVPFTLNCSIVGGAGN